MFLNDVNKKDTIRGVATTDLKSFGIKCRFPKIKDKTAQLPQSTHKRHPPGALFNVQITSLPTQLVTLKTGQQVTVPKVIHEFCTTLIQNIRIEGLFRREGSKTRQNHIKTLMSNGTKVTQTQGNAVDIAALLKYFLRSLPEPLIPYAYHELFLKCLDLGSSIKLEAILLVCLLLPMENLNILSYLLQFFNEVSLQSESNKMTAYNLAVCLGPALFPVENKYASDPTLRTSKTSELFALLIENALEVGALPDSIILRIQEDSNVNNHLSGNDINNGHKKLKKRRSGSITRMFSGLKKIVSVKSDDTSLPVSNEFLATPIVANSKRRKIETKKTDMKVNNKNVECTVGYVDVSKKKHFQTQRKWFTKSRSVKQLNKLSNESDGSLQSVDTSVKPVRKSWCGGQSTTSKNAISDSRCNVSVHSPYSINHSNVDSIRPSTKSPNMSDDFVRVPKLEYEQIKDRVTAIEQCILVELEDVRAVPPKENLVSSVQNEYERTLNQSMNLSPSTDQLAKRLNRELNIRKKSIIIRSPSARKIGSIRQKSQERGVNRTQSLHAVSSPCNLRRGKPNTVNSGLVSPSLSKLAKRNAKAELRDEGLDRSGCGVKPVIKVTNTDQFLNERESCVRNTRRSSLVRLRWQNAGMVIARAKLFENGTIESFYQPSIVTRSKSAAAATTLRGLSPQQCRALLNVACDSNSNDLFDAHEFDKENDFEHLLYSPAVLKRGLDEHCTTPSIKKPLHALKFTKTPRSIAHMQKSTPLKALTPYTRMNTVMEGT